VQNLGQVELNSTSNLSQYSKQGTAIVVLSYPHGAFAKDDRVCRFGRYSILIHSSLLARDDREGLYGCDASGSLRDRISKTTMKTIVRTNALSKPYNRMSQGL
jgi:hypothetical protein